MIKIVNLIIKIINLLLIFIMLSLFVAYFFINIKELGRDSYALELLCLAVLIGAFILILQMLLAKKIMIRKSFFVIVLFFTYLIFRIVIDTQDIYRLKALTIASNGGMILYYISGILVGFSFLNTKRIILSNQQLQILYDILIFIFIAIFSFFYFNLFIILLSLLREDIFLIKVKSNYQRVANFMLIVFIMLYHFIILMLVNFKYKNKLMKFLFLMFIIWFFVLIISGLLFSQLIGSNNLFVNLIILLIVFVTVITLSVSKKSVFILSNYSVFGSKVIKLICFYISISTLVTILLLFLLITIYDIDISWFRIFGFGRGITGSITTRLELWNNFFIHLEYSFLLGNMMVDTHTTGEGTYVHSLIGSLLTHLGLFGFLLFFVYLFFAIRETLKENMIFYNNYFRFVNNIIFISSFLIFAGMFLVASAGVFFNWIPIWFMLGFIFSPFIFINKSKEHNEKSIINSSK